MNIVSSVETHRKLYNLQYDGDRNPRGGGYGLDVYVLLEEVELDRIKHEIILKNGKKLVA